MSEIEVKRFYLYDTIIKDTCANCGKEIIRDLSEQYMSYPPVNEAFNLGLYCEECGNEQSIKVRLNVSLEKIEE